MVETPKVRAEARHVFPVIGTAGSIAGTNLVGIYGMIGKLNPA